VGFDAEGGSRRGDPSESCTGKATGVAGRFQPDEASDRSGIKGNIYGHEEMLEVQSRGRPTAGEIAAELFEAIDNLPEGFGDKEKWRREREMEDKRIEERGEIMEADVDDGEIGAASLTSRRWDRRSRRDHTTPRRRGGRHSSSSSTLPRGDAGTTHDSAPLIPLLSSQDVGLPGDLGPRQVVRRLHAFTPP